MLTLRFGKFMKRTLLARTLLAASAAAVLGSALRLQAAPISSLNVVFNGSNQTFTAGVTTNTTGSGQIWVQAFTSPDGNETINLQLVDNGVVIPNGMSPASLTTQATLVTYGFPSSTALPITFFRSGTGLVIRATLAGSTITKDSASFTVLTSSPTKLVVLAPGETHAPGTNPSVTTGKSGSPSVQTPNQPFPLTVILTDNSFNKINTSTHTVSFASGDLTTLPSPGTLTAGAADFNTTITGARTARTFTVSDTSDATVLTGSVRVETSGPPEQEVFPFPSPFNPTLGRPMTFRFHTAGAASVTIKVLDQFGQKVWDKDISATGGFTDVAWDGRNQEGITVAAGVYYSLLEIDGSVKSKKRFGVTK